MTINELKFDENGLITAVVQDFFSKKVLTADEAIDTKKCGEKRNKAT